MHLVVYYLQDELDSEHFETQRSYYHIDNFYHRIYVIEEMIYRIVGKLMLHRGGEKAEILDSLGKFGYKNMKNFLKSFSSKTQKIRDRRKDLVHRTGYSAQELVRSLKVSQKWSGIEDKKSTETDDEIVRNFCYSEQQEMHKVTAQYLKFVTDFVQLLDKHIP